MGRGLGHVTQILGHLISGMGEDDQILHVDWKALYTEPNNAILVKTSRGLDHVPHLGSVIF